MNVMCEVCGKDCYGCHEQIFGDYCFEHLLHTFDLYPAVITEQIGKKVFLKRYHSALHFVTF